MNDEQACHCCSLTQLGCSGQDPARRVRQDDGAEVHTVQLWVHACGHCDIYAQGTGALIDLASQLPSPIVADCLCI